MWRPFASSFADHAYANFVRKINRVESAPLQSRRENIENYELSSESSIKSRYVEAQQRLDEYVSLKTKVKRQRRKIKERDLNLQKLKEIRIRSIKTLQENEK